ncbi:hypothetical protein ASG99_07665 [Bacillus sp. Soil768D1]|nr:hypothetical protein ASG99_07665 [Bacillus sp. Soil768D1]
MTRRNFLRNILLFIFAFTFGYTIKRESEKELLQQVVSTKDKVEVEKSLTNIINIIESPYNALADWNGTSGTDNTLAIQKCIDNAPEGSIIYIPNQINPYYISGIINLKSSIDIKSNGATIICSSSPTSLQIFFGNFIQNLRISGLILKGVANDWTRKNVQKRSGLSSNRFGIHLNKSSNIVIEDIVGENLEVLFKSDIDSHNLILRNLSTKGVYQPIYILGATKIRGENWVFDCPLDGSTLDHHIYLNSGIKDLKVSDVKLLNGTGQAITIANSNHTSLINQDIYFNNLKMYNVYEGIMLAYGDISNINFSNVYGNGVHSGRSWVVVGFGIAGKLIEDITISNFHLENTGGSLFTVQIQNNVYPKNIAFRDGTVKGRTGSNAILPDGGKNIVLDNVTFTDAQPIDLSTRLIYCSPSSNPLSILINNCTFVYSSVPPSQSPVSIRSNSYELIITNSRFLNRQADYNSINLNYGGGVAIFKNNHFTGFTNINNTGDSSTVLKNNINLKTKTIN